MSDSERRPQRARVVLVASGKGGTGKTLWQRLIAGEASRRGLRTLLVDGDPEGNLSSRCGINAHATGLGHVLDEAGVMQDDADVDAGAERLRGEVVELPWSGVDLIPAGAKLQGMAQVAIPDLRLLRVIFEEAKVLEDYDLVLLDSGGRTGSLVSSLMYLAEVAYAPITPSEDAIKKALQARARVHRVAQVWDLEWAGVVLTGFSRRSGDYDAEVYAAALRTFGAQVRADLPARAVVTEAYGLQQRLGDRRGPEAHNLAGILEGFLMRDLLGDRTWPEGILR